MNKQEIYRQVHILELKEQRGQQKYFKINRFLSDVMRRVALFRRITPLTAVLSCFDYPLKQMEPFDTNTLSDKLSGLNVF